MFSGTMIDELFEIVERAEDHAHLLEGQSEPNEQRMYPGFMANVVSTNQDWLGVA